jgi:hypothetical protein
MVGRDNTGIISTGPGALNLQYRAQQATVLPPEANLPILATEFVGRAADLARLEQALSGGGADLVVQAVHGLGGIGKSTLAACYAAAHRRDYRVIWWVTADSPAGIDTGLAGLATALQPVLAGLLPLEALRERAVACWPATIGGWWCWTTSPTPATSKDCSAGLRRAGS